MTEVSQVNHYSQLIGQLEQRCATLTTERDLARAEARAAEARADEAEWQRDDWKRGNDMFVAAHNGSVKRAERAETKLRALRERMEALANFWWREDGSEAYSVAGSVARRHAGELREALGAPATEAHHDEESHEQASQSTEAPHATASAAIRAEGEAPARATPRPDRGHSEQASAVETAGTPGLDREHTADQRDAVPCVPRRDSVGEPPACADCGAELNEGEAKCFTVCDTCWAVVYPPNGEPPHGDAPTPQRDESKPPPGFFHDDRGGSKPGGVLETCRRSWQPAPDSSEAYVQGLERRVVELERTLIDRSARHPVWERINELAERVADAAKPAPELPAGWRETERNGAAAVYRTAVGDRIYVDGTGHVDVSDGTPAVELHAVLSYHLAQHTPQAAPPATTNSNASGGERGST